MGKLRTFQIHLQNPRSVYQAGDTIQGNLTLDLGEPMQMRSECHSFKLPHVLTNSDSKSSIKVSYSKVLMQYIGETGRAVRQRMYGHIANVKKAKEL